MARLITVKKLREWNACSDVAEWFNELFPHGATLAEASAALIKDGHPDWSNWLWEQCSKAPDFREQTVVTAGDYGTATAGRGGTAIAGYGGMAIAGDCGTATVGYGGTAIAGYGGMAIAGDCGTATVGYGGTATVGYGGTATAGDDGTATAGRGGTATAGDYGTATAGNGGTVAAREGGMLILKFWNLNRYMIRSANVGENGIKPNVKYKLDATGEKFTEVV